MVRISNVGLDLKGIEKLESFLSIVLPNNELGLLLAALFMNILYVVPYLLV